jgi:hypothetical protein
MSETGAQTSGDVPTIYQHASQPAWGRGLLVAEREQKRFFFFEDGKERKFTRDYWSKLETVALPPEEAVAVAAKIRGLQEPPPRVKGQKVYKPIEAPMTFDEQLKRFETAFPGGFEGEKFVAEERGLPESTAKDAFKASAIARAKEKLGAESTFADVKDVLKASRTLLFPAGESIPLGNMAEAQQPAFVEALHNLLHGEGEYVERFDKLVESIKLEAKKPTWPMATLFAALFAPESHVFVKPGLLRTQAAVLAIPVAYGSLPTGKLYAVFQEVGNELRRRLEAAGQKPRDLMDVYSFSALTLKEPAA